MTISEQLKKLRETVAVWAREHGGVVLVVARVSELAGILGKKPGGVRVVLLWDSETKRGDFEETGRVDRKFKAIISVGTGLKADRGEALTDGSAGGTAFYDICEEARETIRAVQVEAAADIDEVVTDYLSMTRFELDGAFTDDVQIDFQIATQLPTPTLTGDEE